MIDDVIGDPWEMLGILKRESQSVLEEMKDYLSHLCPEYLERLYLGPQYNLGDEFMHPSPGEIRKNLSCLVFRGQSDAEKPPIDTASRNHGSSDIEYWRFVSQLRAIAFQQILSSTNYWESYTKGHFNGYPYRYRDDARYLAQHYGLATTMLDFTMDPEVAMYFACTKYDEDGNLKDMECSKGVVFQETFHISDERNGFSVIPVQLPYRPLEQQGFVRDMSFSPYIVGKKYTFKHDPDFSREISDKMGGREFMFKGFDGTLVEIANVIKQQNVFGTDTLTEAQSMCKTPDSIMKSAELSFIKDTPEWMNQCESTLSSRLPDEWELIDQYSIAESLCNPDSFKPLDYYKYLSLVQTNDINVAIQHDIQKEAIRDIFNNNSVL